MVALVCQEEEMDTVVIFVVSPLNARLNAVLRLRWEPESLKESSISFLLVEKEEKKLLAEHWFALKDFNLLVSSRWTVVLFWKETKAAKFLNNFSGTTCTLMVKEIPFLNGNLSIYSCFTDILYDLRRILALTLHVFGRFYLREMIHDPVSITRMAFKDKIKGFWIKFFDK